MSTILVWVLVGFANYGSSAHSNPIPPLADLESCQRVADAVNKLSSGNPRVQCVQVKVPAK